MSPVWVGSGSICDQDVTKNRHGMLAVMCVEVIWMTFGMMMTLLSRGAAVTVEDVEVRKEDARLS